MKSISEIYNNNESLSTTVRAGVTVFEINGGKIVLVAVDGARLAIRREEVDFLYENEESSDKKILLFPRDRETMYLSSSHSCL